MSIDYKTWITGTKVDLNENVCYDPSGVQVQDALRADALHPDLDRVLSTCARQP